MFTFVLLICFNDLYECTWVEATFHVFPNPVLDGPHKLARANLSVHLCWEEEADLRPAWTKWETGRTEGQRLSTEVTSQQLSL